MLNYFYTNTHTLIYQGVVLHHHGNGSNTVDWMVVLNCSLNFHWEGNAPHMPQDAGQRSADVYDQRLWVCFAFIRCYIKCTHYYYFAYLICTSPSILLLVGRIWPGGLVPFQVPEVIRPQYDPNAPNALVMPRPSDSHQVYRSLLSLIATLVILNKLSKSFLAVPKYISIYLSLVVKVI